MKDISQSLFIEDNINHSAQPERDIRQILKDCQSIAICQQEDQIIRFVKELPILDPLTLLQQFDLTHQLNFYWENQQKEEAIAAIGAILKHRITDNHQDRFLQVKYLINHWQKRIIQGGKAPKFLTKSNFFCSFTFSDVVSHHLYSPFASATVFLPSIQITKRQNKCFLIQHFLVKKETSFEALLASYYDQLWQGEQIQLNVTHYFEESHLEKKFSPHHIQQDLSSFRQSVISALNSIEQNQFSKLVIAHSVDLTSPFPFPVVQSLKNLRKQYPNCYIFAVGNGRGSHFLGASPERLLSLQNHQLMTDAIAGSSPRGNTFEQDRQLGQKLLSNEKEKREHQAVITFIYQRLQQLGLTVKIHPTTLLKLSNIQHLWTLLYSDCPPYLHALDIIAQLHPTPAVSGAPTAIACQEIQRYEPFDRSLYAAPIGWIDEQGNSEFVVGIRSALVTGNQARLYAGAGIVAGSNPDQEVTEIQLKLQAMLKTLL